MRFLRSYEIRIQTPENEVLTIRPPFSVSFEITRNTLASVNSCSLTIKNLSPTTRSKLFKDRYTFSTYWQIVIIAGYLNTGSGETGLKTVFQGNINETVSFKQGPNYLTKIEAFDGLYGITNGFTSQTFNKNTDKKSIIDSVIKDMPNMLKGVLGASSEGTNPRGQVIMGQSNNVLSTLTGGNYFIDNETVNVLDPSEYIEDNVILLDSERLLETPKRRETFIDCLMQFTPEVKVGNICELDSITKEFNGQYKIMGFTHQFNVSTSSSGISRSMVSLYAGENVLRRVDA